MRAQLSIDEGVLICTPETRQDSSLLSVLSRADALMVRDPSDRARGKGDVVEFYTAVIFGAPYRSPLVL